MVIKNVKFYANFKSEKVDKKSAQKLVTKQIFYWLGLKICPAKF